MKQEFKLQDPGEGVHEVDILDVLVAAGDEVSEGQEVLTVESDKASIDLPSPYAGTVDELRVKEGDTVVIGDVLLVVEDGAETKDDAGVDKPEELAEDSEETPDAKDCQENAEDPREAAEETSEQAAKGSKEEENASDRPDAANQPDVPAADEAKESGTAKDTESEGESAPVPASPAARKMARTRGVDLAEIEPTGKDGQVVVDDVKAAAPTQDAGGGQTAEEDIFGPVKRRRMSSIRAATAKAMARSWQEIPQVVHEDEADITELELWRRRQGDDAPTMTPIVAKAAAVVLRDHPRFNAMLDTETDEIVLKQYRNINLAVATDRGLVTPVVRGVDDKSVRELAREMEELSEKAREKKLEKSDISSGTFTITNIGGIGGRGLAPLINPPQTAILGLARARAEPVATGELGECAIPETRMMLPLVVAFDHRVIDGADAARFTNDLVALLADPVSLAMTT